ncbi:carboxyvinyl-carboxyphosphonate phosphorylmutase [Aliidongia dinghuensis]|uniref:Carboxyvinyl-carboxyphosphonate phosphorylmutase n=1 Tax=Aliidongia dinghuensis TaxID=1867774 RepID=A0A8J2Z182_9PROT|nr:isocitrate lyase/PEP mutase family protein [Aliidongia dinghuensis]GGF50880.1 carboxyvinyl-carboxyphosphonate phosphorylmutase [Aliidongia dinghuensis]
MSKCRILHDLIQERAALPVPGVYDAFSALMVEQAGFKACQVSGFGVAAAALGLPDIGILSMRDQINAVQSVANAVTIPVMADGDTGFGNALNTFHTVRLMEAAGAAGINIEDQTFPKRCGHMNDKSVVALDEMVQKVRAAVAARRDPYFVINARTDALATDGLAAAIERANAYLAAGATLVFVEAPGSREDIAAIVQGVDGPVSVNMVGAPGGKTPSINLAELRQLGVGRVSFPGVTLSSAGAAMRRALNVLKTHGDLEDIAQELMPFAEMTAVVGLAHERAREREFAA